MKAMTIIIILHYHIIIDLRHKNIIEHNAMYDSVVFKRITGENL